MSKITAVIAICDIDKCGHQASYLCCVCTNTYCDTHLHFVKLMTEDAGGGFTNPLTNGHICIECVKKFHTGTKLGFKEVK